LKEAQLDTNPCGAIVNGVAVQNGLLTVALEHAVKTSPGNVVFFDSNLQHLNTVPVGALPDFIVFSPDGRWVLVANEGEPNTCDNAEADKYGPRVDPEGAITIIDLSTGVATPTVNTATFTAFNGATLDPSIRIFGPNATVAQDLEPESIAVSPDSTTAYVTLQENNAMAVVDIASATVTQLSGLGFKDFSQSGLDASDWDRPRLERKGMSREEPKSPTRALPSFRGLRALRGGLDFQTSCASCQKMPWLLWHAIQLDRTGSDWIKPRAASGLRRLGDSPAGRLARVQPQRGAMSIAMPCTRVRAPAGRNGQPEHHTPTDTRCHCCRHFAPDGAGACGKGRPQILARAGTMNGSSRREQALTSFCTSSLSLLTSAATNARFMGGFHLQLWTSSGTMNRMEVSLAR
jgi:hypothetical protein